MKLWETATGAEIVKASGAIVVAAIAAFGGYFAGTRSSASAAPPSAAAVKAPELSQGLLLRPAAMSQQDCAVRLIAAVRAQGYDIKPTTANSGRARIGSDMLGFWCTRTRPVIYYAVSSDLTAARDHRRKLREAVVSIGGVEPAASE